MQYMVVFLADISKKYYLCRYNVTIKLADRWKTNTIGVTDEAINVDDIIETTNHFRAVDYIIQENDGKLTETYIKQLHLKNEKKCSTTTAYGTGRTSKDIWPIPA